MAKENFKAISDYQKMKEQYGSAGLDFNPADNWSTVDPATGKPRRYTAELEKMKDWDGRKQSIMKMMPDTKDLGLDQNSIKGYIIQGSVTGIDNAKVKGYVDEGLRRYLSTEEGKQEYKALTKGANGSTPMSDAEARQALAIGLFDVGKQQVHSNEQRQYGVDQWAMNANQQAFQVANREDGQQHDKDMAEFQYRKAIEEAQIKAQAKSAGKGDGYIPSPYLQVVSEETTTLAPEALKGILPEGSTPGSYSIPLSNQIVDYASVPEALKPEEKTFMKLYDDYRTATGDKDGDSSTRRAKVDKWKIEAEAAKRSLAQGRTVYYDYQSRKYVTGAQLDKGPAPSRADKQKQLKELEEKLSGVRKIEAEAKKHGIDLNSPAAAKQYQSLNQDASGTLGKIINLGGYADFRINTNANNKRNVGNNMYVEGEVLLTEADLTQRMSQLGYGNEKDNTGSPFTDEWQEKFLSSSGGNGLIKPAHIDKDGNQLYSIPIKNKVEISKNIMQTYDKNNLETKAYTDNLAIHGKEFDIVKINPYVQNKIQSIKDPSVKQALQLVHQQALSTYDVNVLEHIRTTSEAQLAKELKQEGLL